MAASRPLPLLFARPVRGTELLAGKHAVTIFVRQVKALRRALQRGFAGKRQMCDGVVVARRSRACFQGGAGLLGPGQQGGCESSCAGKGRADCQKRNSFHWNSRNRFRGGKFGLDLYRRPERALQGDRAAVRADGAARQPRTAGNPAVFRPKGHTFSQNTAAS